MVAANLTGRRFEKWVVVRRQGSTPEGKANWLCRCDCGTERLVPTGNLNSGVSKGCGCDAASRISAERRTHGRSNTHTYYVWQDMKKRCLYPKHVSFASYGGRGISVCDQWVKSFEAFFLDMGEAPDGMSIERNDVNGNYEPSNCRWATAYEQHLNTRRTKLVDLADGRGSLAMVAQCKHLDLDYRTVQTRINKHGWDIIRAFSTPTPRGFRPLRP